MKNLKNLGKVLSSKEQKRINGGKFACGKWGDFCPSFAPICCPGTNHCSDTLANCFS